MLYRYQTMVSEMTFLFFLELLRHQKYKSGNPTYHKMPAAATHDNPSSFFHSARHENKRMALNGLILARKRKML
jgi:hypothetical protein